MANIIEQTVAAINRWNAIRNDSGPVINYFNQGSCFVLSRDDYKEWKGVWEILGKPSDFSIHGYFGLVPNGKDMRLALFGVDQQTDSLNIAKNSSAYEDNIKELPYQDGLKAYLPISDKDHNNSFFNDRTQISEKDALKASMAWDLYKDEWVKQQDDMVQVFRIPFSDMNALFDYDSAINEVIMIMALTEREEYGTIIDMMLWGSYNGKLIWQDNPQDFLEPCPPYYPAPSQYHLLP